MLMGVFFDDSERVNLWLDVTPWENNYCWTGSSHVNELVGLGEVVCGKIENPRTEVRGLLG